ncbi:type II toxin-antitoxin system PemK/MazF family toxin [Paenibacillus ehimensis]|uniref:type II toxin-antitoxin system PemK/MazF family toxin n=1 Tax=Paenibacillus ehimensis TaxID=79264 RepID=UPI003D29A5C3
MFPINRKEIKKQTKLPGSKNDLANTNAVVFDQWKLEMWNIMDKAQQQSIFNLGHWIIFHDRWLVNLSTTKVSTLYKYGDIVMAELGATNFGSEPQYEHPCVVLANEFASVLIVPCTSVKPHKPKYADELDASAADGFKNDTRIQLSKHRWIDKKRITEQVGKVTNPAVLRSIENYILKQFPAYHSLLLDHTHEIALLENELKEKRKEIHELQGRAKLADNLIELFRQMREQPGVSSVLDEAAAALGITVPKS